MEPARLRLGQLLVDARIIPQEQLEDVLHAQKDDGRRLGTLLVERGLVNETQLTQILSQQLSVPWVSLYHIDFSRRLLNLVPAEVAQKYCLVPIYVRKVRGQGDTLYVAMDDPTNEEALRECAAWSGLPTRAMIASPSDIIHAVEVYYGVTREKSAPSSEPQATDDQVDQEPAALENPPIAAEPPQEEPPQNDLAADDSSSPASEPTEQTAEPSKSTNETAVESIPATMPAVSDETESAESPRPLMQSEADIQVDFSETEPPPVVAEANAAEPSQAAEEKSHDDQSVSVELGEAIPLADVIADHRPAASPESDAVLPKRKGFAFTLLDGTSLPLPGPRAAVKKKRRQTLVSAVREETDTINDTEEASSPSSRPRVDPSEFHAAGQDASLTARDVISALRAASHGVDPADILGQSARWEALFSALLSLLLQRGVIDDDEFIDELKRI